MKKFLYIFLVMLMVSCEDELYQDPLTEKVSTGFYSSEIEIEEAVNGVYAALQFTGLYKLYIPVLGEIPSDNTFDEVPANDGGRYGELDEFATITTNNVISGTWGDSYKCIQRANTVLSRIEAVTFENEAIKAARKGEMKFIRALLYFNMIRIYGDVPLVTMETVDPNDYFGQGRTPIAEVYAQIKVDLTEAIDQLPVVSDKPGGVVKTAAQTLLAKVHLTLKEYSAAQLLLTEVVNSNQHKLLATPDAVFDVGNELNREIIFAVQFASGVNGNSEGSNAFQQFSPSGTVSGAKGHNLPTPSFAKLYGEEDLRKEAYIGFTKEDTPFCKKYKEPSTEPSDGESDWIVLRYADVLLMLAEVENQLDKPGLALDYLNKVRIRAAVAPVTTTNKSGLAEMIALERRLELIGEGHRWFDLKRTDKAIEVMNNWFENEGINITIGENDLVAPVPQSQVDTDPAIVQNPGY